MINEEATKSDCDSVLNHTALGLIKTGNNSQSRFNSRKLFELTDCFENMRSVNAESYRDQILNSEENMTQQTSENNVYLNGIEIYKDDTRESKHVLHSSQVKYRCSNCNLLKALWVFLRFGCSCQRQQHSFAAHS